MKKTLSKHLDIKLIKLVGVLSLIFCMIFNLPIFVKKFSYIKYNFLFASTQIVVDAAFVYGFCFMLFLGLAITRASFVVGSVLIFFGSSIALYYFLFLGIPISAGFISSLFSKNSSILSAITDLRLILLVAFSIFICIYTINYFGYSCGNHFLNRILCALSLALAIYVIIMPLNKRLRGYIPSQYLHSSYTYFAKSKASPKVIKNTKSPKHKSKKK